MLLFTEPNMPILRLCVNTFIDAVCCAGKIGQLTAASSLWHDSENQYPVTKTG
jgi:hypothetical protein